jgi:hypothetical protein
MGVEYVAASQQQVRYEVSPLMMAHEVDCELAGDDAQVIPLHRHLPYRFVVERQQGLINQ